MKLIDSLRRARYYGPRCTTRARKTAAKQERRRVLSESRMELAKFVGQLLATALGFAIGGFLAGPMGAAAAATRLLFDEAGPPPEARRLQFQLVPPVHKPATGDSPTGDPL